MAYTVVFTSTYINPTNNELKNGHTVDVSFRKTSGTLPTIGAVLKRIRMTWSSINVYGTGRSLSSTYGTLYLSNSHGSHTGTLTSPKASILQFTGGTIEFVVLGAGSGTANALNVRNECVVTMTVEWEARNPSTGILSATQGTQGKSISMEISAADPGFTHEVLWRSSTEGYSVTQNLEAGVTSTTFDIPEDWPTGPASVFLRTYCNGDLLSPIYSYSWTVLVDGTKVYPNANLTLRRVGSSYVPDDWKVFVQGFNDSIFWLGDIDPGESATITKIECKIGNTTVTGNVFSNDPTSAGTLSGILHETGDLYPIATLTNSFGNSTTISCSRVTMSPDEYATDHITVYPYEPPKITSCIAYRCLSNGVANDYGAYLAVTAAASISSVNGLNSIATMQVQAKTKDGTAWSTGLQITNGEPAIINAGFSPDLTYEVRVLVVDQIQNLQGISTTKTFPVLTSECVLFFKDGGLNVSVGTQGTRDNAVEINENWHIYHGNRQLDGVQQIEWGGTGASTVAGARNALGLGNTAGPLPVANGGTGGSTVAAARKALGLGETDGALPIANGGTGAASATAARQNLQITPENIGAAPTRHEQDASTLTSGTLPSERLPFKMCAGGFIVDGESNTYVYFANASYKYNMDGGFTSPPIVLVAFSGTAANTSGNPGAIKANSITKTSFGCVYGASSSTLRDAMYIAIGS